jgi:hypothetical protein
MKPGAKHTLNLNGLVWWDPDCSKHILIHVEMAPNRHRQLTYGPILLCPTCTIARAHISDLLVSQDSPSASQEVKKLGSALSAYKTEP